MSVSKATDCGLIDRGLILTSHS